MIGATHVGAYLLHLAQLATTAPAEFLIASVWQGLLLTGMAWLGLEAFPKIAQNIRKKVSPDTRFTLWMVVFLLAAVLPFMTLLRHPSQHTAGRMHPFVQHTHISATWAVALVSLWVVASLISLSRLLWHGYRLHQIARNSTRIPGELLTQEIHATLHQSGSRSVRLALSDRVDCPMVIGFFRPVVVIPQWLWPNLSPAEMNQVVLHEMAHLKRGDDWTNLLQKFLRALFPLNPALIWAERQLCWEREMACDDAVLTASVTPREYATCLTNLAEKRLLSRMQSLAPGAWSRRSELAERVHRILKRDRMLNPPRTQPILAAFLAAFLGLGAALARCPQLVTFTDTTTDRPLANVATARELPAFMPASFPSELAGQPPARLMEASMRRSVPAHKPKPVLRRSAVRRHSLSVRTQHPRLVQTAWLLAASHPDRWMHDLKMQTNLLNDGPQMERQYRVQDASTLLFTVFEVAPPLPAYFDSSSTSVQVQTIHVQAGWISVQL